MTKSNGTELMQRVDISIKRQRRKSQQKLFINSFMVFEPFSGLSIYAYTGYTRVQFPIDFLRRLKLCQQKGGRIRKMNGWVVKAWTTALAALIFGARNHNGGNEIPSQLVPPLHTYTHNSLQRYHTKAAAEARTFPAPLQLPTQYLSLLLLSTIPPSLDTHSFCFGREFMITESPLKCSINNEHKSKSWLKCSILPPLAATAHTYTSIHINIYIYTVDLEQAESFCGPPRHWATAIVVTSHMAIQRLSIIYHICMLFNVYSFSS